MRASRTGGSERRAAGSSSLEGRLQSWHPSEDGSGCSRYFFLVTLQQPIKNFARANKQRVVVGFGCPQAREQLFTARRFRYRQSAHVQAMRSEEHTSELQSLMRISYAVFCLT